MTVETLIGKPTEWLSGEGADADLAVMCQCRLVRNLSDYLFPEHCREDEKEAVQDRLAGLFDTLGLLATGSYWPLSELDALERRFLVERRLITPDLLEREGARGVYIADDQSLSIVVNDENHLTIYGLASGMQLQEVWARINLIDDSLAGALDYAFEDRLGYLTTSISDLGTGLKASTVLHLPALTMSNEMSQMEDRVRDKRHALDGLFGHKGEAHGDLYRLINTGTLGRSEEELLFHVKHLAGELMTAEREARERLISEAPLKLEDRVGRALGLAQGARVLAFSEALAVLSSLRLGVTKGLLDQFSLSHLNDVLVASQDAHIELKCGRDCDELTLSAERADLFRARFA